MSARLLLPDNAHPPHRICIRFIYVAPSTLMATCIQGHVDAQTLDSVLGSVYADNRTIQAERAKLRAVDENLR